MISILTNQTYLNSLLNKILFDMKKYLFLLILSLLSLEFFSCKEEKKEEESKGISGVYTSSLNGQYSSASNKYENNKMLFVFSRRNNSEYILYITDTIKGALVTSPISIITVSDSNKIKGDFYLYGISSGWVRGSIDGIISRDSIYGSFTGHIPYQDPSYPIHDIYPIENGRFTLKYKSKLSQ